MKTPHDFRLSTHATLPLFFGILLSMLLSMLLSVFSPIAVLADELRVMSFNIRYGTAKDGENHWDKRKLFVAETIATYDPDLLGTQETIGFQKDFLAAQLPGYTSVGVGREDGKQSGEMTALFFRTQRFELLDEGHFWLSETPEVAGSKSWDSSLPRMCSWVKLRDRATADRRPILFINTHFDHRGNQARIESAQLLRRQAQQLGMNCDIILTGDFNAAVDSEPYQRLFSQSPDDTPFIDTFASAGVDRSKGEATFSGFRGSVSEGARIDWIATRGNWKIIRAAIDRTARDGRSPSDHYPVTASLLQLAEPPQ